MPDALKNRPVLDWPLNQYFEAFLRLSSRRQAGFAENPLEPTQIECYARIHGFQHDMQFFYRAMTELDSAYMEHLANKRDTPGKGKKNGMPAPPSLKTRR